MAPECHNEEIYTEKSDVWSFAICLYEIFTLGKRPFPNIINVREYILNGGINDKPDHCPENM